VNVASPAARRCALLWAPAWAVLAVVALSGCAGPRPADDTWALTAAGRLSVRVDASPARPAQSMSAAFEWRGDGVRGALTLLSPLGTQLALARWSPGSALLITPEGETRFDTLDELAERALGERVPLVAWPDWLAGRPWPGAAATPLPTAAPTTAPTSAPVSGEAPAAVTAGFEQLGWRVDLSRHAEGRIEARRSQPPAVTVRIVLDPEARAPGGRS
jgi:outer membrane lipoprotein LolB